MIVTSQLRVHSVRSEHSTDEQGIPGESSQTNINIETESETVSLIKQQTN